MWKTIVDYLVLPAEISPFERDYLERVNRVALGFFLLHPPVFMAVAALAGTGVWTALWMSLVVLAGPVIARKTLDNPRNVSTVYGVTAMLMGALLVHFGQGQVQIEMHFYFFVLLALLAVAGNPMVVVVAAVTAAVHHGLLYFLLPSSVFNYDAQFWVVGVHALFVVLESVAAVFVARSFFDNVIGLEKIVSARTAALDARNADMRLLLDNVDQGFLSIDRDGVMAAERSAAVGRWFGAAADAETFPELLGHLDEEAAEWFQIGFEGIDDGFMPLEVCIDQLPAHLIVDERHYAIAYKPLLDDAGELERMLVVIDDTTAAVEAERAENAQRELMQVFDRVVRDRVGFLDFFEEASGLVDQLVDGDLSRVVQQRFVHTLKGNCGVFGVTSIATLCHDLESRMVEDQVALSEVDRHLLRRAWQELASRLGTLLGDVADDVLEVDAEDYERLFEAIARRTPRHEMLRMVSQWKCEPMSKRLGRIAEQVRSLGGRLGKGEVKVHIAANGQRLPREELADFWSAFVHVVRNAVDHGLERPDERLAQGKGAANVWLSTYRERHDFIVEIRDDGRGIDWSKVAEKAAAQGLPCESRADLEAALFADGMSTKDGVSETSGRGVGMGAVRDAYEALGGTVEIESASGLGTTFRFKFPTEVAVVTPDVAAFGLASLSALARSMPPAAE